MPRPTLASTLKNLRTFTVLLTQTTEEELWSHFCDGFKIFERNAQRYTLEIEDAIRYVMLNPYATCSWRHGEPPHEFEGELSWIRGNLDEEIKPFFYMRDFYTDLKTCAKQLKWETDEEYGQQCREMLWACEKSKEQFRSDMMDLQMFDKVMFDKSRKEWYARNPEFVEQVKLREDHRKHKTQEEWKAYFENDPDELKYYNNEIPKDDETCPLCIGMALQKKLAKDSKERAEREDREDYERSKQRREEALRLAEAPESPREVRNYDCDDCDFHTTSRTAHDLHIVSANHLAVKKQKTLYCEACDVQCRTVMELSQHKTTKKHKHALNPELADPETFSCEACAYSTEYKHVYNTHLRSKKHQSKVNA
jgi:hypothetical protein